MPPFSLSNSFINESVMKTPIEILVVDDHPIVRKGLIQIITGDGQDIVVIAEAESGEEALVLLEKFTPDVIVTDFKMSGMTGLELAQRLKRNRKPLPVVLLTMYEDEGIFNAAANAGVGVFLLKEEAVENIQEGIRAAAEGRPFVSPSLGRFAMRRSERTERLQQKHSGLQCLTPSEHAVLRLIADDKSTKEIADVLSVSPHTIASHRSNIAHKLDLSGKSRLLNFALSNRSAILNLP